MLGTKSAVYPLPLGLGQELTMDAEQVTRYFNKLYEDGQSYELVAIQDGKARRKWFQHGVDSPYDAIAVFEAAEHNIYASAMPRDVQEQSLYDRVWVDQDDVNGPWPWGTDSELQWPQPTTLVKTSEEGGGFRWQAIWLLDKPVDETKGRAVMRRLASQIGADKSVHDPRRILRVPGVVNAKRGYPARLMDTHDGLVSLDSFNLPTDTLVGRLLSAEVNNPNAILGEWLAGAEEGERNKKAYVCARFLRGCGVVHDDALSIVALGGSRCDPPLPEHEIRNAVRSAYHGQG